VNPLDTPKTFSTERLQLAIYLHASRSLPFLRCEGQPSGKVRFVFEDGQHTGSEAELEFDLGAQVAAFALFAAQKFLRRKMSEALNNRRIEEYANKSTQEDPTTEASRTNQRH
jgi:hypothetical protein